MNTTTVEYKTGDKVPVGGLVSNHTKAKVRNAVTLRYTYSEKLVMYGKTLEHLQYPHPKGVFDAVRSSYEKSSKFTCCTCDSTECESKKRRFDSLWRTRTTVTRIIQANIDSHEPNKPVFVTLTFAKNVTSIPEANAHFKYFSTKLAHHFGFRPHYLAVVEFQKRGAIHYHLVYFNLPFVNLHHFQKLWGHGFTRVEVPKRVDDVTKYVGKYMQKELLDPRLKGEKAYFTSRGLSRPTTIFTSQDIHNELHSGILLTQDTKQTPDYKFTKYRKII